MTITELQVPRIRLSPRHCGQSGPWCEGVLGFRVLRGFKGFLGVSGLEFRVWGEVGRQTQLVKKVPKPPRNPRALLDASCFCSAFRF